jgi:hypothetical protein
MENQFNIETVESLNFNKQTTAAINLETLRNTIASLNVGGTLPKNRPVAHHDFITWISQEFEDALQVDAIIEPIHISARHSQRIKVDPNEFINPKDPMPINRLHVQRLVTKIYSPIVVNVGQEKICPSIAISYNEKGIEIAYGANVWACANMNIFGKSRWSTYGRDGINYESMKTLIQAQLNDWERAFERDLNIIERLQRKACDLDKQRLEVAKLFEVAVRANTLKRKETILNTTQCIQLQAELLKRRDDEQANTWWDFTQAGTENLKPTNADMISLHPTIELFNDWVCKSAEIDNAIIL